MSKFEVHVSSHEDTFYVEANYYDLRDGFFMFYQLQSAYTEVIFTIKADLVMYIGISE